MKLRLLPLIVVVIAAGCGGGGSKHDTTSQPAKLASDDIAVVGSHHVTVAMYDEGMAEERAELQESGETAPKAGTTQYQEMRSSVIDSLVNQAELAIEAAKLGISVTPAEVQSQVNALKKQYFGGSESKYKLALSEQHLTDADVKANLKSTLLQDKVELALTKNVKASSAQIGAYYKAHASQYTQPETRKVREILAGKNQEKLAETIYKALQKGSATFAALAKKYSQDPGSKDSGGLFTATKGKDVPEFDAAVFAAASKTGQLLQPVNTAAYGWFVIQVLAPIVPGKTTSEAKAAASIRKTLNTSQEQKILTKWGESVAKSFCTSKSISYNPAYTPSPNPCAASAAASQTTTT